MDSKKIKPKSSSKGQFPPPTREEYFDFLVRCYFGEGVDLLKMAVDRAYLDLNRTLHGFATHINADLLRSESHKVMISLVGGLRGKKITQSAFDRWHFKSCEELRHHFWIGGFERFTYGQAQKWINMTLKYVFTMGEKRLPGFESFYPFAHIPIDNVFMDVLQVYKKINLPCAWSRIDDYEVYLKLQKEFRSTFPNSIPLAVEFRLWITGQTSS
jgi:hypothetical protein